MNIRNLFAPLCLAGVFACVSYLGSENFTQTESVREASSSYKQLNDSNFESTIAEGTVIVDFYADWCAPCKKLGPIFEQVASEMGGKLTFAKANVDQNPKASQKYRISSIPTLIIFKDGKEVKRRLGGADVNALKDFIQK